MNFLRNQRCKKTVNLFSLFLWPPSQLVNMMSIGTLMAYSIVAACVLLLRYEVENEDEKMHLPAPFISNFGRFLWNSENLRTPTKLTAQIVTWEVTIFCTYFTHALKIPKKTHFRIFFNQIGFFLFVFLLGFVAILFAGIIEALKNQLYYLVWWAWVLLVFIGIVMLSILVLISRQPTARTYETFAVPFIPWLPGISIIINMYLMVMLDFMTWVRFGIWIALGLVIYVSYGLRNSVERKRREQKNFVNNKQNEGHIFTSSKEILVPSGQ